MYIWGRLARAALTKGRRGPYRFDGESRLTLRCWPTDVDQYGHMNNARYTMVSDVGRIDVFMRSGVWGLIRKRRWGPMMDGSEIAFLREIRLWKRFDLFTSIDCWTERHFLIRHRLAPEDGRTATLILAAVGMYDFANRRFVTIPEVMAELGIDAVPRDPLPQERSFLDSHAGLRALGKSLG